MPWTIQGAGEEQNPAGYDGRIWQWELIADHDADERRFVLAQIGGTVMAMGEEALPARVAMARRTQGRSEVEMILEWPEPPAEIDVHSHGIRTAGGDPGDEQREINEIAKWFDERGATLVFGAHGAGSGSPENIHMTHSAHVLARDEDRYLFHAEGSSRLEAARRAQSVWEAEDHGNLLGKLEAGGTSDAELKLTIDRQAVEALRLEGFRVVWTEPTDPEDPIWMGQAFNDGGDLLEMAIGSNPEDVLLELAEALLPDGWKSEGPQQS